MNLYAFGTNLHFHSLAGLEGLLGRILKVGSGTATVLRLQSNVREIALWVRRDDRTERANVIGYGHSLLEDQDVTDARKKLVHVVLCNDEDLPASGALHVSLELLR